MNSGATVVPWGKNIIHTLDTDQRRLAPPCVKGERKVGLFSRVFHETGIWTFFEKKPTKQSHEAENPYSPFKAVKESLKNVRNV